MVGELVLGVEIHKENLGLFSATRGGIALGLN